MTEADFKRRYPTGKFPERLNKAIRGEIPGGSEALDALTDWYKIRQRKLSDRATTREELALAEKAEEDLQIIKDAMVAGIREKYNMPER